MPYMKFKFINNINLLNLFTLFIISYLIYHLFYGKYNIGNYLINDFQEVLLDNELRNLESKIKSIDKDLNALYTNKEDFLDEVIKKKYAVTSPGEILIKLN